jgi:hypothetical protein
MMSRNLLWKVGFVALVVSWGLASAQGQKKTAIAYPTGYRKWTHVKSMVIFSKAHKLLDRFGGLHAVYVNDTGLLSLQQGKGYPDGSTFVFDLQDVWTFQGAIETKGRKLLGVMKKNAKLYPDTGG